MWRMGDCLNWNYHSPENNEGWRKNDPLEYLSLRVESCSHYNWFPVRSIFHLISIALFGCSHKTGHTLDHRSLLNLLPIEMDCLCCGCCRRKKERSHGCPSHCKSDGQIGSVQQGPWVLQGREFKEGNSASFHWERQSERSIHASQL